MKNTYRILIGAVALSSLGGLNSCTTTQQRGAQYGAIAGAAAGVLTGDDVGDIAVKTGVAAAIGVGVATILENQNTPARTNEVATQPAGFPAGVKTATNGYVKSPYSPYNVIDVRGIASGTKVTAPGSNNIFIVP